ncbi:MAG: hypothetical protein NUW37_10465 [Planctomycetes bacterium]|nr:hypothetical protein [Planctomycetota bacterium]
MKHRVLHASAILFAVAITGCKPDMKEYDDKMAALDAKVAEEARNRESSVGALTEDVAQLPNKDDLSAVSSSAANAMGSVENLRQDVSRLRRELDDALRTLDASQKEASELADRLTTATNDLAMLRQQMTQVASRLSSGGAQAGRGNPGGGNQSGGNQNQGGDGQWKPESIEEVRTALGLTQEQIDLFEDVVFDHQSEFAEALSKAPPGQEPMVDQILRLMYTQQPAGAAPAGETLGRLLTENTVPGTTKTFSEYLGELEQTTYARFSDFLSPEQVTTLRTRRIDLPAVPVKDSPTQKLFGESIARITSGG